VSQNADPEVREKLADRVWRLFNLYQIRTKVAGMEGQTVTFRPNKVQRKIYKSVEENNRTIILKPRKLGCTTGIVIYLLDKALWSQNQLCRTIAHRKQTVGEIFVDTVRYAFNGVPDGIRPDPEYTTRAELAFKDTGSKYSIDVEARGVTPTYLHLSETAYMEDEAKLQDTLESLPTTAKGICESTAQGKGNWFERTFMGNWQLLQQGRRPEWYPLFFAWYDDPNNSLPHRPGIEFYYWNECLEQRLKFRNMDGSPLTDSQLLWWDRKRWDLGNRLPELYPSAAEEAFIYNTGRVYDEFDRHLHVIPPMVFKDYEISMDYGQTNPMVFLLSNQDYDNNFTFFREFYRAQCPIEDARGWLEENAPEKVDGDGWIHIKYPDPSVFIDNQIHPVVTPGQHREHRSSIADEFQRHKILLYRGTQNDVQAGIARVKEYLKFDPEHIHPYKKDEIGRSIRGSPRVFFTENCPSTIGEFPNYLWPKDPIGALNQTSYEVPIKKNDHGMDAVKYRIFSSGVPLREIAERRFDVGTVGRLVQAHLESQEERSQVISEF
jgi:hypothetical protein